MPTLREINANYDVLKIPENGILTVEKWNTLVGHVEKKEIDFFSTPLSFSYTDGKLGIGTSSPKRAIHIKGTGMLDDDILIETLNSQNKYGGAIIFHKSRFDEDTLERKPPKKDDILGEFIFRGYSPEESKYQNAALIRSCAANDFTDAKSVSGDLIVYTRFNGKFEPRLHVPANGKLVIKSEHGSVTIGANNTGYLHFYTDRNKYYFNKEIRVDSGKIGAYNGNLKLCIEGDTKVTVLKSNGSMGIGTTSPTHKLHVKGDLKVDGGWLRVAGEKGLFFQDYGGGFCMSDSTWIRTYNNKSFYHEAGILRTDGEFHVGRDGNRFIVKQNGSTTINGDLSLRKKLVVAGGITAKETTSFMKGVVVNGMLEAKGKVSKYYSSGKYAKHNSNWKDHDSETQPVSIYASSRIVAPYFITYSDKRVKENILPFASHLSAFDDFMKLKVYSYNYKFEPHSNNLGFIAQEVEKVLPHAVNKIKAVIPNICKIAKVTHSNKTEITFSLNDNAVIKKGTMIRLHTDKEYDVEVIAVENNLITVNKWSDEKVEEIFVYGTLVDDLKAVDYNNIFTLNVGLTQHLKKEVEKLKEEIQQLKFGVIEEAFA